MKTKVGIVGFGHLGYALYQGFTSLGYEVLVNNDSEFRTKEKLEAKDIHCSKAISLGQMAKECTVVLLCVRSKDIELVCSELSKHLSAKNIVVSFLAQTSLDEISSLLTSEAVVVKAMTTLGVAEQNGVTAYQILENCDFGQAEVVKRVLLEISAAECVFALHSEEEMQLFTVVVGCFPGVLAYFLGLLQMSVQKINDDSFSEYQKVLPTLLESVAGLLRESGSPITLSSQVATKGGVTETMVGFLESSGLESVIDGSVNAGLNKMSK